jgi:hypothetical protein
LVERYCFVRNNAVIPVQFEVVILQHVCWFVPILLLLVVVVVVVVVVIAAAAVTAATPLIQVCFPNHAFMV